MRRLRFTLSVLPAILTSATFAQTVIWQDSGLYADGALGAQAAIVGDIDGDGRDDVACGDPDASPVLFLDGQILVYSGRTGAVIHTINPANTFQGLGWDVACAGDVDGDGIPDIAATSFSEFPQVFSGATGLLMHTMTYISGGTSAAQIVGLGDVNGDGFGDVAVGLPSQTVNGNSSAGLVHLISGDRIANGNGGAFLDSWSGTAPSHNLGDQLDVIDDLNGDSIRDLIASAPNESGVDGNGPYNGVIHVYSGQTGAEIRNIRWYGAPGEFSFAVASAGDLDQDGFSEIVVGSPFADVTGSNSGRVQVYSGADGSSMYTLSGNDAGDLFGWSVSAAGDIGGDGYPDLLVGAQGDEGTDGVAGGAVWIFSGKTGAMQSIVDIEEGGLGSAVAGPANFDGDAYGDFVAGAGSLNLAGRVYGLTGNCLGDNYGYCTAAPNTFAAAGGTTTASGSTSVAAQDLTLLARNCPPNKLGIFFYGTNQVQLPVGDGNLCTSQSIQRIYPVQIIDAAGMASLALDWNNAPVGSGPNMINAGDTKNFSFWFRDPLGGPVGFNYTTARSVTFCP